ncbi:hypothetical protein J2S74_001309 [Evansella vedderi]|uniref:Uncharacterized protein n=1 Tax=Evansella vedderi TaxID=38282 RepID=A0ABT9ZRS2_9BACI|nr:hypothetical protein [Evansella vedderi]MDQ0253936.1 hypothetical protein [Evansella vedderi]
MKFAKSESEQGDTYELLPYIEEEHSNDVLNRIVKLQLDGHLSPFLLNNYLKTRYWREEYERKQA